MIVHLGDGIVFEQRSITTDNGRRLRTFATGDGDDLVVLEAGLGGAGLTWVPVMELIAGRARVVAYDRAGYGTSDPDPRRRTFPRLADDLRAVVAATSHRRLVLVGHSWGGPIVRYAAAALTAAGTAPVGLVLVDPSDEHALPHYTSRMSRLVDTLGGTLLVALARIGLAAPLARRTQRAIPPALREEVVRATSTPTAAAAIRAELKEVSNEIRRLAADPPNIDAIPTVIVSGQLPKRRSRAKFTQAHRESVAAHSCARLVPANRSGHMVHLTEPKLVADEILHLLEQ